MRTATPIDVVEGRARWCVVVARDCLDVLRSLPERSVDAVVTDPPYASTGDAASIVSAHGVTLVPREVQFYEAWAREHLAEWNRRLKPTGAAWFTCDWRGAMTFDLAAHKLGFKPPAVGVWDREGLGMGHLLRHTYETFVVFTLPRFERKAADVPDVWRIRWTIGDRGHEHAAEKPLELYRRAVRLVTDAGAVVVDPFAGSGTTGEAALLEGRRVILVEREEGYAELCRRRCEAADRGPGADWRKPEQRTLFEVAAELAAEARPVFEVRTAEGNEAYVRIVSETLDELVDAARDEDRIDLAWVDAPQAWSDSPFYQAGARVAAEAAAREAIAAEFGGEPPPVAASPSSVVNLPVAASPNARPALLCACVAASASLCTRIRYYLDPEDDVDDPCECPCHDVDPDDDDG